ncbi:LytR family transcriptional regulator, partial [Turicibacter sanguinis]|nr:LytR family transcriptional regulator [Turicibacter sanguinis]
LYYLVPRTLSDNVIEWHDIVYEMSDYQPSSTVATYNQKIINNTGIK